MVVIIKIYTGGTGHHKYGYYVANKDEVKVFKTDEHITSIEGELLAILEALKEAEPHTIIKFVSSCDHTIKYLNLDWKTTDIRFNEIIDDILREIHSKNITIYFDWVHHVYNPINKFLKW